MTSVGVLRRFGVLVTALAAWAGLSSAAATLAAGLRPAAGDMAAARLDELLALVALTAAWLLLTWLALGVVLSSLTSTPRAVGGTLARLTAWLTPALVRRGVAALVGGALLVGPVAGAQAASAVTDAPARLSAATIHDPAGVPEHLATGPAVVFDRPQASVTDASHGPAQRPDEAVVVRRGDTLWEITARHLGPDATPARIATEWPRWHAANREVIGANPGLIRPGQLLVPPTS